MRKTLPKISILLPVCNAETYLAECLDSLLRQSYADFEIIAVEDKSRDASLKLLRVYAKKDKRIRVFTNIKRYGLAVCLNRAIRRAEGQYVTFMEASDKAHVHKLKRQVEYLEENSKTVAVGSQCRFMTESGREIEKSEFPSEHTAISTSIIPGKSLQFETLMINRRILPKDMIIFKENSYPLVYADALVKLIPYGMFANLDQILYSRRLLSPSRMVKKTSRLDHGLAISRLWLKSITVYDYRPNLRSLFPSLSRT